MKKIVSFIYKAYRHPRLFIQLIAVRFRQLLKLSSLVILLTTTFLTLGNQRIIHQLNQSFTGAIEHLPDYQYQDGQLSLDKGEKPLYYHSSYLQLVIDDTVQTKGNPASIQLDQDKVTVLREPSLIGLYLFQDQAYAQVAGRNYQLNIQTNDSVLSREALSSYLAVFQSQSWLIFASQWIILLVITILTYWFQQLIYATLLSSFNRQLAMPLDFKQRLKLSIGLSAFPMIVLSFIRLLFPGFISGMILTGFIIFFTFHHAIKEHTFFVQKMFSKFSKTQNQQDFNMDSQYDELDYMDNPATPKQNEQINHLLNQAKKEANILSEDSSPYITSEDAAQEDEGPQSSKEITQNPSASETMTPSEEIQDKNNQSNNASSD